MKKVTPVCKVWSRWVAWLKSLFGTNIYTDKSSIMYKMYSYSISCGAFVC